MPLPATPQIQLYMKDESTHVTGSLKHRLARSLFLYALCNGWINQETPIIEAQLLPSGNEIMKIHPLARWNKSDVDAYITEHSIPTHPLFERGYMSIGCWPCTRAVGANEQERDGRWAGLAKTECGIHSFGKLHGPQESEAEQ